MKEVEETEIPSHTRPMFFLQKPAQKRTRGQKHELRGSGWDKRENATR